MTIAPPPKDASAPAHDTGNTVARQSPIRILLLTAWFALVAGLLESAFLAFQQHALHRIIYRSPHYLWMPAAGAFLLFATVMLIVWLLSLRWRALTTLRAVTFVLVTLTFLSAISVPRALHWAAAALLSLGAAVMLSRRISMSHSGFERVWRSTFPFLVLVEIALLLFTTAAPSLRERSAWQRLAAQTARAPNVLFLILDTVRAQSLSLYGYARRTTPNIDAFGHSGVVFDRAIAPTPWTLPSHASMFTGQPPYILSADRFTALDDAYPTLAEEFARRGYGTAGFVANLAYASYEFGLERGFLRWEDYSVSLPQILANASLTRAIFLEGYNGGRNSWLMRVAGKERWFGHTKTAADINAALLRWVSKHDAKPFFAFANYFDAHMPYLPPRPYLGRYGPVNTRPLAKRLKTERPGRWPKRGNPIREAQLLDRYEESIAYLDAQVGALLSALQRQGLLRNTLVVIASDHGEEFGEHGQYEHDTDVFFSQVHVPLIMVYPGALPSGKRVEAVVGLQDVAATILEVTRMNDANRLGGSSFASMWTGYREGTTTGVITTLEKGRKSQASLITEQYQYIRFADSHEELFDHRLDVAEAHDLSTDVNARAALPDLRARLRAQLPPDMRSTLKLPN